MASIQFLVRGSSDEFPAGIKSKWLKTTAEDGYVEVEGIVEEVTAQGK